MKWTSDMDSKLIELYSQKIRVALIAKELGITVGSVVGRYKRLKEKASLTDLQPAYDPKAQAWFLDEPQVEAKSIQELLKKLPKGSTIKDYTNMGLKKGGL